MSPRKKLPGQIIISPEILSQALRKELQQTQTQLDQLTARTSTLEQQVRALEQSNAELWREVRKFQVPREPRWDRPQTNQVPHLNPLQTN